MKRFKTSGFVAALAAASLMTFASAVSASTLTSPEGTTYTGAIVATSTNSRVTGPFVAVECSHSEIKAQVQKHGSKDAGGAINSLTFTGCNYTTTVKNNGSMDINSSGGIDLFSTQVEIQTSVGTCVFTADSELAGGTSMGSLSEGVGASIKFAPGEIDRTAGNFLCGKVGYWTGSYEVTSPGSLWVD